MIARLAAKSRDPRGVAPPTPGFCARLVIPPSDKTLAGISGQALPAQRQRIGRENSTVHRPGGGGIAGRAKTLERHHQGGGGQRATLARTTFAGWCA